MLICYINQVLNIQDNFDILRSIAIEDLSSMLHELDHRLFGMKVTSKYLELRECGTYKDGYFGSNANCAAFEQ
jgi:hypothetical protein